MINLCFWLVVDRRCCSPAPLKLSVEVLENSDNPVVSEERDAQTRRLAHVLEVRCDSAVAELTL